ncbi:ALG-2 like alpha-mannosyltransferase [Cryptosporidium ubiquitum]|uniref:Alpha-1,3/1,6-mannosyltransferase ALG2 n=1 Tax=Cryptosporidium ubiquitum TaxID=857276 RepID=A0A1J4MLY4_9CRYT|nr:ALG-2 like alpha-mannosyltransferase [Cryptosporidium ubiquitum]OII74467.1 ALG-2 like alpha-mannosyltransferase [Cryptosporidium ubiquitum]
MKSTKKVAVLHLDCGIGGAEQLMVLASLALQSYQSSSEKIELTMFTSHHDNSHSFSATNDGRIKVIVFGNWIPRSLFGYGTTLFSYIRMTYISLKMFFCVFMASFSFERTKRYYDVILNDQVSVINPILKLMTRKLIFYCHYPDQLLVTKKGGYLRNLYRYFMDFLEEFGMRYCDYVFVNSIFTRKVYIETFKGLIIDAAKYPVTLSYPEVLYPPVNLEDIPSEEECENCFSNSKIPQQLNRAPNVPFFLSLNRYERKKNIELAIKSFAILREQCKLGEKLFLVISGGYDKRVKENIEYFEELLSLANSYAFNVYIGNECIESTNSCFSVVFLKSISDSLRWSLLRKAIGLLYTPEDEHFGMVPCEAMSVGTSVIACNSGGPTETIINGKTGFLCEPNPESFANRMSELIKINKDNIESSVWSSLCKERIAALFSQDIFQKRLCEVAYSKLEAKPMAFKKTKYL